MDIQMLVTMIVGGIISLVVGHLSWTMRDFKTLLRELREDMVEQKTLRRDTARRVDSLEQENVRQNNCLSNVKSRLTKVETKLEK